MSCIFFLTLRMCICLQRDDSSIYSLINTVSILLRVKKDSRAFISTRSKQTQTDSINRRRAERVETAKCCSTGVKYCSNAPPVVKI